MYQITLTVARGKRFRMGGELPKQFLPIGGEPVLTYMLEAFHRFDKRVQSILVLPQEQQGFWRELRETHRLNIRHETADGGRARLHSVKNGLALISGIGGMVRMYDGVRPFVSQEVTVCCFREVAVRKAVISVIDVVETVHHLTGSGSEAVNHNDYKLVQTPQVSGVDLLRGTCEREFTPLFTDDVSVIEATGAPAHLVRGNRENIRIATLFDLKVVSALL